MNIFSEKLITKIHPLLISTNNLKKISYPLIKCLHDSYLYYEFNDKINNIIIYENDIYNVSLDFYKKDYISNIKNEEEHIFKILKGNLIFNIHCKCCTDIVNNIYYDKDSIGYIKNENIRIKNLWEDTIKLNIKYKKKY